MVEENQIRVYAEKLFEKDKRGFAASVWLAGDAQVPGIPHGTLPTTEQAAESLKKIFEQLSMEDGGKLREDPFGCEWELEPDTRRELASIFWEYTWSLLWNPPASKARGPVDDQLRKIFYPATTTNVPRSLTCKERATRFLSLCYSLSKDELIDRAVHYALQAFPIEGEEELAVWLGERAFHGLSERCFTAPGPTPAYALAGRHLQELPAASGLTDVLAMPETRAVAKGLLRTGDLYTPEARAVATGFPKRGDVYTAGLNLRKFVHGQLRKWIREQPGRFLLGKESRLRLVKQVEELAETLNTANPTGFAASLWLAEEIRRVGQKRRNRSTTEAMRKSLPARISSDCTKWCKEEGEGESIFLEHERRNLAEKLWDFSWRAIHEKGAQRQLSDLEASLRLLLGGSNSRDPESLVKSDGSYDSEVLVKSVATKCQALAFRLTEKEVVARAAKYWADSPEALELFLLLSQETRPDPLRDSFLNSLSAGAFYGLAAAALRLSGAIRRLAYALDTVDEGVGLSRDKEGAIQPLDFDQAMVGIAITFDRPSSRIEIASKVRDGDLIGAFGYLHECLRRELIERNKFVSAARRRQDEGDVEGESISSDPSPYIPAMWADLRDPKKRSKISITDKMIFLARRNTLEESSSPLEFDALKNARKKRKQDETSEFLADWRRTVGAGDVLPATATEHDRVWKGTKEAECIQVAWLVGDVTKELVDDCCQETVIFAGNVSPDALPNPDLWNRTDRERMDLLNQISTWAQREKTTKCAVDSDSEQLFPNLHRWHQLMNNVSSSGSRVQRALNKSHQRHVDHPEIEVRVRAPNAGRECQQFRATAVHMLKASSRKPERLGTRGAKIPQPNPLSTHWRVCFRCRLTYAAIAPLLATQSREGVIPGSIFVHIETQADRGDIEGAGRQLSGVANHIGEGSPDAALDRAMRESVLLREKQMRALFGSRKTDNDDLDFGERTAQLRRELAAIDVLWKAKHQDTETAGIRGGILKRLWLLQRVGEYDEKAIDLLKEALETYRVGWRYSGERDPYTGVNIAALCLFLGKETKNVELQQESRRLAGALRAEAVKLETNARAAEDGEASQLDYWDRAAIAELTLLAGGMEKVALDLYKKLFESLPDLKGAWAVAARQANLILEYLGNPSRLELVPSGRDDAGRWVANIPDR